MILEIVVPVFNEKENIKNLLDELSRKIKSDFFLTIIYDNDEDTTLPVVKRLKRNYSFEIFLQKNLYGSGFGNAVLTAIKTTRSEYWAMVMADLSDDLETIDRMYEKIKTGYDIVVGSRYMAGGKKNGGPFLQTIFSRLGSFGMCFIMQLPVDDVSNAFRMYRKEALLQLSLENTSGADILLELLLKAYISKLKITQVPTTWSHRAVGKSNFKMWKLIPKYLYWCGFAIYNYWFVRKTNESEI